MKTNKQTNTVFIQVWDINKKAYKPTLKERIDKRKEKTVMIIMFYIQTHKYT